MSLEEDLSLLLDDGAIYGNDLGDGACTLQLSTVDSGYTVRRIAATLSAYEAGLLRDWLSLVTEMP
jgi:hypothetical protein